MKELYLKKEYVEGGYLSQNGVLSYIALRNLMSNNTDILTNSTKTEYISLNRLYFSVTDSCDDYDKPLLNYLKSGIEELLDEGLISIVNTFNFKYCEYLVDVSNLYLDVKNELFVVVDAEEIKTILTCKEIMKTRIPVFNYFINLLCTFNLSTVPNDEIKIKLGSMPIRYISSKAGVSKNTAIRYSKILEDMKIIYISKSNDKVRFDNRLRQINNCYSRYKDKYLCEKVAKGYENKYGCNNNVVKTKKNKAQADNNRRLAAIYNRICEGHEYDQDVIKEVYSYVKNTNKKLQDEINEKEKQDYVSENDRLWIDKLKNQIREEEYIKSLIEEINN